MHQKSPQLQPVLTDSKHAKQQHRKDVAAAQTKLQNFIALLQHLPFYDGVKTLSMDLYVFFESWCGVDLPEGFNIEFGRQITKACKEGRLPFERKTTGRASLATYKGLDLMLLKPMLEQKAS